jgi:hypothetical protein
MTFTQKVRFNLYREVRLLGHHAIMTRSAKVFQGAFRLPYSNWPTTNGA